MENLSLTTPASISKMGCIAKALDILGDKWTPLLIKEMSTSPQHFSELERSLQGISPRTLSQRLAKLVEEEIIDKHMYCEHPPRFNYALTSKGTDLQDILISMANWSAKYRENNC